MKYLSLHLFLVLISQLGFTMQNRLEENIPDSVSAMHAELLFGGDTLKNEEDFPIYLLITNRSEKPLFIPKETDLVSNIYPNGLNVVFDGGIVKLKIEPVSGFASIIEENTRVVESVTFVKIKPKSTIKLYVGDLQKHIRSFNSLIDSEELRIKKGFAYTIQVTYFNNRTKKGNEKRTFLGNVTSQKATVFIE